MKKAIKITITVEETYYLFVEEADYKKLSQGDDNVAMDAVIDVVSQSDVCDTEWTHVLVTDPNDGKTIFECD